MKAARVAAALVLLAIALAGLGAGYLAPARYDLQYRDHLNASPCRQFPLGTDELGRDRFSRLLYATRVSLFLAPCAALLSVFISALLGILAGHWAGWPERLILSGTDLVLSLPWLFLMLTVRALLPLNITPWLSIVVTFALLGMLGWAQATRVVHAAVRSLRSAGFVTHARACGCSSWRVMRAHILPNLKSVLLAQFWILVPVFLLSEANLGLLGLGVSEPLPSLGTMLRDLENLPGISSAPWLLAPAVLLLVIVSCFHLVLLEEEVLV